MWGPCRARGLAGVGSAVFVAQYFDLRVDDVGIRPCHLERDAPFHVAWETVAGERLPVRAGVFTLPDAAPGTAAVEAPACAPPLVGGSVDDVRIGRIEHDIRR